MKKYSKLIIWAVIVIAFAIGFIHSRSGETCEQYQQRVIAILNQSLAQPHNDVFQQVENAALTITAKSGSVKSCRIQTIDGSDNAGKNGSNVAEIDVIITVIWDGYIQKNGYTDYEIDYDLQHQVVRSAAIVDTNAMVNLDSIDWFSVGVKVGALIASLSGSCRQYFLQKGHRYALSHIAKK